MLGNPDSFVRKDWNFGAHCTQSAYVGCKLHQEAIHARRSAQKIGPDISDSA